MKKGARITEIKTGKTGNYLRQNPKRLSIDLWVVKFHGDNHETIISPSLLLEGQFDYATQKQQP